jgi:dTDP-glucose pyrophosphorylase
MAGGGSRFIQAGYSFPKPLIEINGKPMIQAVVDSLNIDANYIYVVQREHYEKYALGYLLNLITPNCKIVQIDGMTEGAACTTLLAQYYIDNDSPLLLANSDQIINWNSEAFFHSVNGADGSILIFENTHPKWSYVKINEKGYVTEVAEKVPISNKATVGVYFWKKGSDYVKYASQMIDKNVRVGNEFYVCPVFNEAIVDGLKIKTYNVSEMWGVGTPEDLERYLNK